MTVDGRRGRGALAAVLALLRVSPDEVGKVLAFALLAILGSSGLAIGLTVSSSLFLVNRGADELPFLFLAMPFVMALYTPVFSFLLRRFGIDRLYQLVLALLVGGGVLLAWVLPSSLGVGEPLGWALYLASLYSGMWAIGLYTLFWSFVDDYFDIRDAKRLFPLLTGSQAIGSSLGGLLVVWLTGSGWVGELFLGWAALSLVTLAPLQVIHRRYRKLSEDEEEDEGEEAGVGRQLAQLALYFRRERFVAVLALVLFTTMLLSSLCYFEYLAIFANGLPDWASGGSPEEDLASFLGGLFGIVNAFNLVMNLFVFNRLVAFLGVPRTAMIMPLVYLGVFLGLAVYPGSFGVAVAGFFAYEGLLWSIDFNNQNFLFNALPSQAQKELRLVLEGLTEPVATAVVGGSLLVVQARGTDRTLLEDLGQLAWWGVGGALLALALTLVLKVDYLRAMVVNLKRHWLDFSRPAGEAVSSLTDGELDRLAEQATLADLPTARLALGLLWRNDRKRAVRRLLELFAEADDEQRIGLAPVLGKVLEAGDGGVVHEILEGMVSAGESLPAAVLDELARHRLLRPLRVEKIATSADPEVRAAAAIGLINLGKPAAHRRGLEIVEEMLGGDAEDRRRAFRVLGCSGQERYAPFLLASVQAEDGELRREALAAVHQLATPRSNRLVADLLRALASGPEAEERALILSSLDKIGDPDSVAPLLLLAEGFTPYELRLCERVILGMGLKGVPTMVQLLRDPRQSYKARSIAARALAKLAFAQLEAFSPEVIRSEIEGAYEALRRYALLERAGAPTAGLEVLRRFYRDHPRRSLEFILEILSIGGRLPNYELLATALRSANPKQRGDAIETLEQGLDRELFQQLVPLVEGGGGAAAARPPGDPEAAVEALLEDALSSPVAIEVASAVQSIQALPSERLGRSLRRHLTDHETELPELARALLEERLRGAGSDTIERLAPLATSEYFAGFGLTSLVPLARAAVTIELAANEPVDGPAAAGEQFFLVLDGLLVADGQAAGPGEVVGDRAIWLRPAPENLAGGADGARLLALSAEVFRGAIRTDPVLALGMLEKRFEMALGAAAEEAA